MGVSLAIVRWPGDPREIAPTVTTISVLSSSLICLACYLGAPAFAAAHPSHDRGGQSRLAPEPRAEFIPRRQPGRDDLQRNRPLEPEVPGAIDDAHAAAPGDRLDAVAGQLCPGERRARHEAISV